MLALLSSFLAMAVANRGLSATSATVLQHPVFEGTATDHIYPLLERTSVRAYVPGETVSSPGLGAPCLYLVLSGYVQLFDLSADGQRVIYDLAGPGGIAGFLGVVGLQPAFIESLTHSRLATLSESVSHALMDAEQRVLMNLLATVGKMLERRQAHLARLALRQPTERLAAELLALAETSAGGGSTTVRIPRLSHQALGDMLGLRRETVTLHLARLRVAGALDVAGHEFLLNLGRLAEVRDGGMPAAAVAGRDQPGSTAAGGD